MTRRPGDKSEPPGGRAAERLREFLELRFPGGVPPDDAPSDEEQGQAEDEPAEEEGSPAEGQEDKEQDGGGDEESSRDQAGDLAEPED
jgi:hypothetical protein